MGACGGDSGDAAGVLALCQPTHCVKQRSWERASDVRRGRNVEQDHLADADVTAVGVLAAWLPVMRTLFAGLHAGCQFFSIHVLVLYADCLCRVCAGTSLDPHRTALAAVCAVFCRPATADVGRTLLPVYMH